MAARGCEVCDTPTHAGAGRVGKARKESGKGNGRVINVFGSGDNKAMARGLNEHIVVLSHAVGFDVIIEERRSRRVA